MLNVLYVCVAITLFQGIQGFGGVGYEFVNGDFVLRPHNSDVLAAETNLFGDDEHCKNVSATVKEMCKLGENMTVWLYNCFEVLVEDAKEFYKCSGASVVSCALKVYKKTKDDVMKMKPTADVYRHEFQDLFRTLRKELPLCLH